MSGATTPTDVVPGRSGLPRSVGVALLLAMAGCGETPARPAAESDLLHRVLTAEDARASSPETMAPLEEALASPDAEARRLAVRALGRFEREGLSERIVPLLEDPEPAVRAEAANALAQAVLRADPAGEAVATARAALLDRLGREGDPMVMGALAQSAGRTRHGSQAEAAVTAAAIVMAAERVVAAGPRDITNDVRFAKGLYMVGRQPAARGAYPEEAVDYLTELLRTGVDGGTAAVLAQRARTLAVAALAAAGRITLEDLSTALADPEPLVRREAVAAAAGLTDAAQRGGVLERGLGDPSPIVRYDAVRLWGRFSREEDCAPILAAARDADAHVALLGIDLLAGCPALEGVTALLDSLVQNARGSAPVSAWHRPAHALVALAAVDRALATERMLPFVANANFFVRAYAATAARALGDATTLRLLARDRHPNVRVVALEGLADLDGRAADALLIEQLEEDDPQLVMTAAGLLEGTTEEDALPALLDALDRFTARRRETERDARMALLERIGSLGPADAARLRPLLADFDPAVAARTSELLQAWTGTPEPAAPIPPAASDTPDPATLDELARSVFRVEMQDGGAFELRLLAWDAPTNAARFARLAEAGYFDGLTYHRVAPNFVVQGGSPGANEYAGDGPFTRDELGLDGNWRGTVGLSTRGRDTGDGQMFINVIDNVRLDHEYTVFAEVIGGMDVVDGLLEGATIRTVTRTTGPSPR